jgi:hypothetical protein
LKVNRKLFLIQCGLTYTATFFWVIACIAQKINVSAQNPSQSADVTSADEVRRCKSTIFVTTFQGIYICVDTCFFTLIAYMLYKYTSKNEEKSASFAMGVNHLTERERQAQKKQRVYEQIADELL